MKQLALSLIAFISAVFVAACSGGETSAPISQAELLARINDKSAPHILDVRSTEEFQQSHVPGAVNLPIDKFEQQLPAMSLKKSDEIVVYCESGFRAGKAEAALKQLGFFEVRHLQGDMRGWRDASLPVQ